MGARHPAVSDCIFCSIVRGEAPATFTHEDDTVVAFMDIQPISHGHMLVVPREHAELMQDVNETVAMRAFRVARRMAALARQTLGAGGVNLFVADGEVAFQDVPHFHVHVIPRCPGGRFCGHRKHRRCLIDSASTFAADDANRPGLN